MTKESAIKYLKLLHELEQKYSSDLFTVDLQQLVQKIRLEFIDAYRNASS